MCLIIVKGPKGYALFRYQDVNHHKFYRITKDYKYLKNLKRFCKLANEPCMYTYSSMIEGYEES